jgi:hypothetical protein
MFVLVRDTLGPRHRLGKPHFEKPKAKLATAIDPKTGKWTPRHPLKLKLKTQKRDPFCVRKFFTNHLLFLRTPPVLDSLSATDHDCAITLSLGAINGRGGLAAGPWPWKV